MIPPETKPENPLLPAILSIMVFVACTAQTDSLPLSRDEINEIIMKVDTLSGERNFHVLLKKEVDGENIQVNIWINNRLGGTMFQESGMNTCDYYRYNNSLVFVYAFEQCKCDVPAESLRPADQDQYSYLMYSPFFVENGFKRALIVKRTDTELKISDLEFIEDTSLEKELENMGF